jgi:hypothetical protein
VAVGHHSRRVEDFNRLRLTADILTFEKQKLRASFIIPEKQRVH